MNQLNKNETNLNNNMNNKICYRDELVYLINNLNTIIKTYYNSIRQILLKSKDNNNKKNKDYLNIIEKELYIFISNAKDIFSKMKNVQKKIIIQQEINQNQLFNYSNNNFFYYSNAPTYENNQYLNKIPNDNNLYKKISYKSPKSNSNFNINYINYNNYLNRYNFKSKSPKSFQRQKIFNNNINIKEDSNDMNANFSSTFYNKKINIPLKEMKLKKDINKDELLKNILLLLKKLKEFKGKIFYETNDAQKYREVFYLILEKLNKLIRILSNEKKEKEEKCLTERFNVKPENYKKIFNINNKRKDINVLDDKRKYSNSAHRMNKTFNNLNTRNIIKEKNKIKTSNSVRIKLKDESKSIEEKSNILTIKDKIQKEKSKKEKEKENDNIIINQSKELSIRNILFNDCQKKMDQINNKNDKANENINENINEKKQKNKELINALQQTENIYINIICKENQFFIDNENKVNYKIIEKEKIIKDMENKIQLLKNNIKSLKEDLSNSNNQLSFFKIDNEKQNKQITNMTQEINLLKQLIENKNKEEALNINKKEKKDKAQKKNNEQNNINIQYEEIETDRDKISIKYELLKLDYDKQKVDLQEKEKLLNDYNLYTHANESKKVDEQICMLIKKHKNEIDELNEKYTRDIINLKVNLPNCFSEKTHEILVDKTFKKYDLHWYLLTVTSAKNKDYENTFWVTEDEIKGTLAHFNKFKNEEEIEKENTQDYFIAQQKLIKRIESNEEVISKLEVELQKYKDNE